MKIKLLLIAALFSVSVASTYKADICEVHAEAVYSMGLSIDTMELPINWIAPSYMIKVPVRVSNNPGISYLTFLARATDNVPESINVTYRSSMIPFSQVSNLYWEEFKNGVRVITMGNDVYYDANDILCYMKIRIPENAQVGDFYGVDFAPECVEDGDEFGFEKDGVFYNEENFCVLQGGGVRITEAKPIHGYYDDDEPVNPGDPQTLGDVNDDGRVDSVDASSVLTYYARISTEKEGNYSEIQKNVADVNNDKYIDSADASYILAYYAYVSTDENNKLTLPEFIAKK